MLQKIAYLVTIPLTLLAAYTGFCLFSPAQNWAIWPMFSAGVDWVGGFMNMRIIHYYVMWVFILFTAIHAYLANIEGFSPSRIIFAWQESPGSGVRCRRAQWSRAEAEHRRVRQRAGRPRGAVQSGAPEHPGPRPIPLRKCRDESLHLVE